MVNQLQTLQYTIAGISFSVTMDSSLEHPHMKDFKNETGNSPTLFIDVKGVSEPKSPSQDTGTLLFDSRTMAVYKSDTGYSIYYDDAPNHYHSEYNAKSHSAAVYLSDSPSDASDEKIKSSNYIFFAIRDIFFIYCQENGMIPLHSSSIIYNGKAYLFSAPSGVGKTTHTDMWENLYHTEILDGDVAMLSTEGNEVFAHGLPWCGTSGRYLNARYPLGKIIFIKQSDTNYIEETDVFNSVIRIYARSFAPNWNTDLAAKTVAIAQEISHRNTCALLKCTSTPEAVETVKKYIDSIR